jgi:hypothetical protein
MRMYPDEPAPTIPRLALKPAEAAKALSISEKSLSNYTMPHGPIPCLRLGSRVLYPVNLLQDFLSREATYQQQAETGGSTE